MKISFLILALCMGTILKLQACEQEYKAELNNNKSVVWTTQKEVFKFMGWSTEFKRWL